MKTPLYAILTIFTILVLAGCGGGNSSPQIFSTSILSDPANDGDIELTLSNTYTITQGMSPSVQSVFAGVDPATSNEFRAFLDFPLGGAGGVPYNVIGHPEM